VSKINKINFKRHDVDFRFLTFECDCRERDMISNRTYRRYDRECVVTTHDERDERRLTLTRVRDSVSLKATVTIVRSSRDSRCRRKTEMSMTARSANECVRIIHRRRKTESDRSFQVLEESDCVETIFESSWLFTR
jgi:hypothetical protein